MRLLLTVVILLAWGVNPVTAQSFEPLVPSAREAAPSAGAGQQPEHEQAAEDGEHLHHNELALALVATREAAEGENFFTVGGEYERRLSRKFGLGGVVEYINTADAWVFVAPVVFHPVEGLKIFSGPGFERKDASEQHESEAEANHEETRPEEATGGSENLFLFRVGAGYSFEFGERFSAGPTLSVDFVRESNEWVKAYVFGITMGVAF